MMAGTLQIVTRSLRVPLYSGCSLKCLVIISDSAVLAACFSVGSRISHVAKLLRQKYWHGMPAFLNSFSKTSLVSPTSLFFKVGNDQREDSWGDFFCDFRDGQYFIAFEIFGKSAHPVFLVFFRSSLLAFPGCGAFLGRLKLRFLLYRRGSATKANLIQLGLS